MVYWECIYIWLISMVNVGEYTSPMDPMGYKKWVGWNITSSSSVILLGVANRFWRFVVKQHCRSSIQIAFRRAAIQAICINISIYIYLYLYLYLYLSIYIYIFFLNTYIYTYVDACLKTKGPKKSLKMLHVRRGSWWVLGLVYRPKSWDTSIYNRCFIL